MQPPQQDPSYQAPQQPYYQPPQTGEGYYSSAQAGSYPPQPGYYAQPQNPYPPQQPGGVYPPPGTNYAPPQASYPYAAPQFGISVGNRRSNSAMVYGFISVAFSLITLISQIGFAGLITGTLAIIYGFIGLNASNKLSNHAGRTQALIGIVLGIVAWGLVIISYIIRTNTNPY